MISGFPTFGRICLGALVAFSALARAHVPAAAAHVEASGQTAKFLSPDPLGLDGGANLYAYADGDPVNRADPLGLCAGSVGSVRSSWERREALANAVRTGFRALGAVALLAAPGPEEFLLGAALKVAGRAATAVARVSGAAADFARGAGLVRAARPAPILARPGAVPMATGVARRVKATTAIVKYDPAFAVRQGAPAYRLWGEGTIEAGRSWTTVNPRSFATAEEFKQAAGLGEWVRPPYNIASGEFRTLEGVSSRTALPVQTAPNPWLPELRVQPPQRVENALINIRSEPW